MAPRRDLSAVPAGSSGRPSPAGPLALFVGLALAIPAAGALSYGASAADLRHERERELATIAALKADEIRRWRDERLLDAETLAADPMLATALRAREEAAADPRHPAPAPRAGRGTGGDLSRRVEEWLGSVQAFGEYASIGVVSEEGEVRFAAGDVADDASSEVATALVRDALRAMRPLISDVYRHDPGDRLHLTVAAPIAPGGRPPREAILLRIDPYLELFRMIQSWPTPSATAEVLLMRREGDRVAFANELRHAAKGAHVTVGLDRSEDPAVRAALGTRGIAEGVDYRDRRVLAAIVAVPDMPWTLVAKVDTAEALAPLTQLRIWVFAGVLALMTAAAAGAALWWRATSAAFERARLHDEAERRALARRIERLTRHAAEMVFLADQRHRILEANDRATAILGYTRDELLGMNIRDLRDPATLADFEARSQDQIAQGAARFETRYRRKDGSTFPVEVSAQAEIVEGRRYFHGIVRDLTERKQAEEALRASEAKFRAAFEFATVGILLVDAEGRLVDTNRAMRKILGRADDELRGLTFAEVHAAPDRPSASAILRQMRDGVVSSVELPRRLLRKDGAVADVIVRSTALRDDTGGFRFALAVVEDVTEKKRLEAQLVLADRMASMGTLAAGVAHEINNPLAFILANLDFAAEELAQAGADHEVVRALEEARDGALRVRAIVRDLKAFSRADGQARVSVDPRRVLQSALALAQHEIRHRARLDVVVADIPLVTGSEHRLGQVFLNLLINAAQAVPEGRAADNVIRAATSTAPDGRAVIEIADTGTGIAPEVLPRIFDPFFTTKPVGVGTGLGLSICHGIVCGLGGEIQVDSTPGQGSTFRVLLPAARPAAQAGAAANEASVSGSAPARRGRILVVDDEPLVGRAVTRILAPHEVVARTSGRRALEDVAGGDHRFDLVLCDLMMPEMSGMDLHARLCEIAPILADRTIFLTGGAFTPSAREFLATVPNARIEKPFEPEALRALVARALAHPTEAHVRIA